MWQMNRMVLACVLLLAANASGQTIEVSGTVQPPPPQTEVVTSATVRLQFNPNTSPAQVRPSQDVQTYKSTDVDTKGGFSFTLAPGSWQIVAIHGPNYYMPVCQTFNLLGTEQSKKVDLRLQEASVMKLVGLRLLDTKKRAMPNVRVRIVPRCHDWEDHSGFFITDARGGGFPASVRLAGDHQYLLELDQSTASAATNSSGKPGGVRSGPSANDGESYFEDTDANQRNENTSSQSPEKVLRVEGTLGKRPGIPFIVRTEEIEPEAWKVNIENGTIVPVVGLNARQKFGLHMRRFADLPSFFLPLVIAGLNQARDSPAEWRQGAAGLARRYASAYAYTTALRNTLDFALDSSLHQDPRYFPSSFQRGLARLGYAVAQTVATHNDQGDIRFNFWETGSAYTAGFISNTWYPQPHRKVTDALLRGTASLGVDAFLNVLREFAPDIVTGPCGHAAQRAMVALDCTNWLLSNQEIHGTISEIAPGNGPGFGLVATPFRRQLFGENTRSDIQASATAMVSPNISYFAEASVRLRMLSKHIVTIQPGKSKLHVPAKPKYVALTFYGRIFSLHSQDFYGLGNESLLSGKTQYRERLDSFGSKLEWTRGWLSARGTVELLQPHIEADLDSGSRTIQTLYSDATAPGLSTQPLFMHYVPALEFHARRALSRVPKLDVAYEFFQDIDSGRFSFRRLGVEAIETIAIGSQRFGSPHSFLNPCAGECLTNGFVLRGALSVSDVSAGKAIPFYFQQTLGGANFEGADTLRGFVDYRFRGPHLLLFQAEYRKQVLGPLGMMFFFDTGKVAQSHSEINFDRLHHDFGPGIYLQVRGKTILRVYGGFGGGEGWNGNAKLASPTLSF